MYASLVSSFTAFLNSLFTWEMLFALTVGICGGLIIGALPGLNPSAGICMLIPLTYRMQPIAALTMLMAIYTAGILGGSYTAILLHTPGTTASVATIADGHAMVNNGKPLKALMASTYASCIGGVISALALLFMAPVLAKLSLKFDAPEYFFLGILGICLIASLAEDSLIKGVISGCLGLLLSTIGTYPLEALYRFTFGIKELRSGLDSTIVLLGLFAISQAITTFSKNRENMGKHETIEKVDFKGEKLSWKERIRNLPLIIYTSILGAFIGILPGAGASIGSFVGYNEAKRLSKNKEQFGNGAVEGILGPEAANNAVTGGAMIPLMTLGIPGSPVAAILLGALMIHGMSPGFQLFTEKASITYPIIFGFLLANILMYFAGMAFVRILRHVTDISPIILNTFVIVFVCVGAYSISNSKNDIIIAAICGIVGYFFIKCGFSSTGLTLGLVLGTMTEKGLRRSVLLSKKVGLYHYFVSRPASVVLMILIVAFVVVPVIAKRLKKPKTETNIMQ